MKDAHNVQLGTDRLIMRRWKASDAEPFHTLNSDKSVMEFMPHLLSRSESDGMIERIENHFEEHGFGLWALETKASGEFIGFAGLAVPKFEAHFTPCVEIGWRLAKPFWGHGYATEAANRALQYGFEEEGLGEIVSFTVPANQKSRAVMMRIGMVHDGNFEHPRLPEGHPLRTHVLYRKRKLELK